MPRFTATLCFAALIAIILTAATRPPTLDWPYGHTSQLPSPDGRHVVYGEPSQPGIREGPELWLRHRELPGGKRLLQLGSTARAFWFADSRHFVVIDRESSSGMTSYIYDTEGRVTLDIRAVLLRHDSQVGAVAGGHFYVEAERFLTAESLRVAAFGHTDDAPVRCFRFIYTVSLRGEVKRRSKRISPPRVAGCDETSE